MRNRGPLFRATRALAAFTATAALAAAAQQTPADAWQAHAETLKAAPGLLRFYTFMGTGTLQPNLAPGPDAPMTFRADKGAPLATEPGRVAGRTAVLLDGDCFEAPALTQPTNAFTIALWLRPLSLGSKTGNGGSLNGMIVASGSGYNDGWRLALYDWKTRQPTLDIGRGPNAFSVRAADSLNAGFWNHLAATWDGALVRLYINGILSAEKPYPGPALAPRAPLKLGYSGYGVGSLKMAADELAVLDRALPPDEIAALSLTAAPLPAPLKPHVLRLQSARLAPASAADAADARDALKALAAAPAAWTHWAALAALPADPGADAACAALFQNPAVPAHLRGQAVGHLILASKRGAALPSALLAKLPEYTELDADEQRHFGLALADAYTRENNPDAAAGVFTRLIGFSEATPEETAAVRLRFAQTLRQSARFEPAREQLAAVRDDTRLARHIRALAALSLAQTWRQENRPDAAEPAFLAAADNPDYPPHLRLEARELAAECANLRAGQPARDPESHRQRPDALPAPALTYFVSPKGSDTNPGTLQKPFASLERARDTLRAQKTDGRLPPGGAAVYLRGGTYAVTNTFTLTEVDSGSVGAPVVYRAWQNERPVLDGGFRVRGLRKLRDPALLARLPPEARGKVYAADLKAQGYTALAPQKGFGYGIGNQTVRELFQDGAPLRLARWPNAGTVMTGAVLDPTNRVFAFPSERLARWAQAPDPLANGYWYHLWAGCTVPVAADPAAGTLTLTERPGGYGIRADHPFYVLNLLEELDQPGEWYLDRATATLYVWPVRHPWFSTIVLTRWDKPFIEATGVQDLAIHGLTLQHGQQRGIVLTRCVNTLLSANVIRRLGGTALSALQSANLKLYGNRLHTLGHTGMHVSGGNRKNLASGQILIENNEVSHFGRLSRTYNPALLLEGCGARVAHNHFHHAPSSAMRIEGNDHLIEYNQVDHVVQESDDQGGIDMWGNPAYRGVVIRFNRWQDIGGGEHVPCGQAGIRFDDAISGMLVYGNLFERTSNGHFGGVQIHGGHNNIIDNNLFTGCRYGVSFSPWGQKRWEEYLARDHVQRHLHTDVNIRLPPYSTRYPELAELGTKPDINSVWRNLFAGAEQPFYKKPKGTDDWDNRVLPALPPDPAAHTAFRPLPLDEIGPYPDPSRATE